MLCEGKTYLDTASDILTFYKCDRKIVLSSVCTSDQESCTILITPPVLFQHDTITPFSNLYLNLYLKMISIFNNASLSPHMNIIWLLMLVSNLTQLLKGRSHFLNGAELSAGTACWQIPLKECVYIRTLK